MNYKVAYHVGETVGLKTKAAVGYLSIVDDYLVIQSKFTISIELLTIRSVEMFRLHGMGRMLKVVHEEGTLFVSVIRYCLFGYYMSVNFFATDQLKDELQAVNSESEILPWDNPNLVFVRRRGRILRVCFCLAALALLAGAKWATFSFLPHPYALLAYLFAGLIIVAGLCVVTVRQFEHERRTKTQ